MFTAESAEKGRNAQTTMGGGGIIQLEGDNPSPGKRP